MTIPSRRTALTIGLGALGLVGRAFGQAPDEANDKDKKDKDKDKAKDAKPDGPAAGPSGLIGTVDMGGVMKGFGKVKEANEKFLEDVNVRKAELKKMDERTKRDVADLATLQPGTRDHAELDAKIKQEKQQLIARQRQTNEEYAKRQAEMLSSFQHEIQEAIAVVARRRGLSLVLRVPKGAEEGANLVAVAQTISREVLYVGGDLDLTEEVVTLLNNRF